MQLIDYHNNKKRTYSLKGFLIAFALGLLAGFLFWLFFASHRL